MMWLNGRDGFITQLQETGRSVVTVTATDDLGITCDSIRTAAGESGLEVRIFYQDGALRVQVK